MSQADQQPEIISQTEPTGRNPALELAEQVFAASAFTRKSVTVQSLATADTMVSDSVNGKRSTVTHTTDEKVRMWKPTPAGYRPRWVAGSLSSIMVNLNNGWKTSCPDCGTDCGDDPNNCKAFPPSKVAYCPKAGCGHKINLRNLALDLSNTAHKDDPNAADLGYGAVDEMKMLKAAMDAHIRVKHPREAPILLGPEQVLVASGF